MKRRTSANGDAAANDEHQDKRQRPSIDGSKKDDHDDMDVDEVRARDDARCDVVWMCLRHHAVAVTRRGDGYRARGRAVSLNSRDTRVRVAKRRGTGASRR